MPRSWILRIRERVRLRQYDMTVHALEEMAENGLDIVDMEHAVLAGHVVRIERDNPRGNKYVIEGTAADGTTPVGVVGRFTGGWLVSDYHYLRDHLIWEGRRCTTIDANIAMEP